MTYEVNDADAREIASQYGVVFGVDFRADGSVTVGIETEDGDITGVVMYDNGNLVIEF